MLQPCILSLVNQLKNLVNNKNILLAFYGDDFTGSTDALEFISRAGARAILFTETPTAEQVNAFPGLNAYGVAGKTRALSPEKMEAVLLPAFKQMKDLGARHIHYKVCSTFDSSSVIGSIGKAIDCGAKVFNNKIIPVTGGMPSLGRYCLFGNLFARMGIGSSGKIYRLDRHPSMSKHPVTPSDESDLRVHLGKQTGKAIGLIDVTQLDKPVQEWSSVLQGNEEVLLFDALSENHLVRIGEWMDNQCVEDTPLFSVGSSGVEKALGDLWNSKGLLNEVKQWKHTGNTSPILVISGSCSPVTKVQIDWAKANDFKEVELDIVSICNDGGVQIQQTEQINGWFKQQKNVIVHTGTKQSRNLSSEKLGTALGNIAKDAIRTNQIKRVVVAGGDTSSYAARAMEIDAVEMIAPLVPGAPLCRAYSKNKMIDGLEINFKGGQVGDESYFGKMAAK
jgi:3-oxoisoapionate kinase